MRRRQELFTAGVRRERPLAVLLLLAVWVGLALAAHLLPAPGSFVELVAVVSP